MKYLASVRSCVIAVLLLILLAPHVQNETASASASSEETFLTRALQAYKWVMADATSTQHGLAWDLYNSKVEQTNNSLYDGTTGVLLFLLELYEATNNPEVLENAKKAANHLLASVQTERSSGFYTGLAGMLYALNETFKLTKDAKYANGADDCYAQIKTGIEQKTIILYSGYDIISGLAGIGLALLYYAEEREDETILNVARECGDALLDGAVAVPEGLKWYPSASYNKEMPNFSHGTSGVAYFLARLYEETEEQKYLDAATKGARYLISIANKSNDQCYIYHSNPGGTGMFYLGWCHGPSGTWRLFYQLYNITEDEEWLDWVKRSANSILTKEFYPKTKTSWVHNRGICCGDAGVAQFFYDLSLLFDEDIYSDKQDEINSVLISRVYRPDGTLTDVYDQNGYMQGGAGIGAWMLQMNAMQNGERPHIWFPDRPILPTGTSGNLYSDFAVSSVKISKKKFAPRESATITAGINNIGNEASTSVKVRFYLSDTRSLAGGNPPLKKVLKIVSLESLQANETKEITITKKLPKLKSKGKYYFVVVVDPNQESADIDFSNNCKVAKGRLVVK